MDRSRKHPFFAAIIAQLLAKATAFAQCSFIIGSKAACFAPAAVILPLAGAFGGLSGSCGMLVLGLAMRLFATGAMPLAVLAYHLPGFFAALYWGSSKFWRIAPIMLCAFLFMAHPDGMSAAWYMIFWIIPLVVALQKSSSLFMTALGSTLSAHAVGTIVWLYAGHLASADFALLVPLVIVERLLFAMGMTIGYILVSRLLSAMPVALRRVAH